MTTFFLGVHRAGWLDKANVPLFVSHRVLNGRKTYPRATAPWALDSGGFTELSLYGQWRTTPQEYVRAVRRYVEEVGQLVFASPQDWMNEPVMNAKTGLSVAEHQRRTVDNYLELRTLDPQLPIAPVIQGWEVDDYLRCVDLYATAGVDLHAEPHVGVGTVCRRQDTITADRIFAALNDLELTNLHGYGVKLTGLARYGHYLQSSDSMAWSYRARRAGKQPGCPKTNCANCLHFALEWRERALTSALEGARMDTTKPSSNATDVLHRKLEHAGGAGVPVDKLSSTEQHTLSTLVRQGRASVSFGIAYRVHPS